MAGKDGPMAKAVVLGNTMRAFVIARLVGAFRFVQQERTMIVVATAVIDMSRLMLVDVLSFNRRMMGRAFPTTFPVVEEWACQHDCCHDCGNDLSRKHHKALLGVVWSMVRLSALARASQARFPDNSTFASTIGNFSLL